VPDKGNPWASSNVLANVYGIVKTSNAVSPAQRNGKNYVPCCRRRSSTARPSDW
jgi:hypothetical protein